MWAPFIGVILACACTGVGVVSGLKSYGLLRRFKVKFILVALAIPYMIYGFGVLLAIALHMPVVNPVIVISVLRGGVNYIVNPEVTLIVSLLSIALSGLIINTLLAIGEETG